MSFFISDAMAQSPVPGGDGGMSIIFLIGMFVIMYFFLIRPQVKRQKEHKSMVEGLKKGDEIQTSGGMMGKMMQGNGGSQMPEIMLKTMMPNCIEIMLPKISVNQRGEVAASILSAIVEKGIIGMSNEQASAFRNTLDEIVSQKA